LSTPTDVDGVVVVDVVVVVVVVVVVKIVDSRRSSLFVSSASLLKTVSENERSWLGFKAI
jgi:hypothetical protein